MRLASLILLAVCAGALGAQPSPALVDNRICSRGIFADTPVARDSLAVALTVAVAQAAPGRPDQAARAAFFRGCQYLAVGRDAAAAKEFERAVKGDDRSAIYHFWLGRAYGEQARDASPMRLPSLARRVRAAFERAIALDPEFLDAREGLVHYYLRAPRFLGGSAGKARAQGAEITRRHSYRGGHVSVMIARHVNDSASVRKAYESLIAQHPDSAGPYLALAAAMAERRDWGAAWSALDRLERAHPDFMPARYVIGQVAAESGEQLERGERALREYLDYAPRPNEPPHALAHMQLGAILERRNDRAGAVREYEAALALDPQHSGAREALRRLRIGVGPPREMTA